MNLTLETSLNGIARALDERIAPALDDPFAIEAARLARIMLTIAANAVDDAAAVRVAENAAIRELFRAAAPLLPDPLMTEIATVGASRDPGLRISELDRENGRLRAMLVTLHETLEERSDPPATGMMRRIWRMLADAEAARAPRG